MKKANRTLVYTSIFTLLLLLILNSCSSGRHISKLRKPDISIADTIKAVENFNRNDLIQIETLLKTAQERAQKSDFISSINECIYIVVENRVAFTVKMEGKNISIERGIMKGVNPTLLIPFSPDIAQNVVNILEDYKLDNEERFNICYVVFMPCLNRMYSMPYLYETSMYKGRLDDYLQFKITNTEGYTYHGKRVEISGTVVNVDGMFILMPGLIGDPDIRLELTLDQAIELYKYVAYDAMKPQSFSDKMKLFKKYSNLVNASKVYERKWH